MSTESPYLKAGAPMACFQPECKKPFEGTCFRGDDGNYYCSEKCSHEGFDETAVIPITKAFAPRVKR